MESDKVSRVYLTDATGVAWLVHPKEEKQASKDMHIGEVAKTILARCDVRCVSVIANRVGGRTQYDCHYKSTKEHFFVDCSDVDWYERHARLVQILEAKFQTGLTIIVS